MAFTNSSLATYVNLSPNCTSPRKSDVIDTIIIHCVVGQVTIESLGKIFANPKRKASSNYGVDKNGKIGLFVEESNRSWCTGGKDKNGNTIRMNEISGSDMDHRAITIEVASDTKSPYAVTNAAYNALIELVADCCRRNNIKQMLWRGDKTLVGNVSKQNMAVHRWFANKACPGDYLYSRMGQIADMVNIKLCGTVPASNSSSVADELQQITMAYDSLNVGDIVNFNGTYNYTSAGSTAKAVRAPKGLAKVTKKVKSTYTHPIHVRAVTEDGSFVTGVYGWVNVNDLTKTIFVPKDASSYRVMITATRLNVRSGPGTSYSVKKAFSHGQVCTIIAEKNGWGQLQDKSGWISLKYAEKC